MTSPTTSNNNAPAASESYAFSAGANQLLSLIASALCSNKEAALLGSSASNSGDALGKARCQPLAGERALDANPGLSAKIAPDKANNALTTEDAGAGATKADLASSLGAVAKPGAKALAEALSAGADVSVIGQFGVGFYSARLLAGKVEVASKNNDDERRAWASEAGGSFAVAKTPDSGLERGTRVILRLKEDMSECADEKRVKDLAQKHSELVGLPTLLYAEKTAEKEVTDDEEEEEDLADDDKPMIEEVDENEDNEPKKRKMIKEVSHEWGRLSGAKPLWARKAGDAPQGEREQFYKSISSDWEDYAAVKHFSVEGQLEFKSLLCAPERAPLGALEGGAKKKHNNIKLYARRAFIMDNCEDVTPEWLNFAQGVVDSEDLPLSASREALQQSKILRVIKKNLVKKCIEMFTDLSENEDAYKKFYENFSKNIKLGIHEDSTNRAKLSKLLRRHSTKSGDEMTSLEDYVSRVDDKQPGVCFIAGESKQAVETSPFLERLKKKGCEVLYLVDPIDEYAVQQMKEFEDKKLISATKEGLDVLEDDDEKAAFEAAKQKSESLCKLVKDVLDDKVEKVVVSNRLDDSPCCLVTGEYGWSANMERIMKAQALRDPTQSLHVSSKKTMEINPTNPIIVALRRKG